MEIVITFPVTWAHLMSLHFVWIAVTRRSGEHIAACEICSPRIEFVTNDSVIHPSAMQIGGKTLTAAHGQGTLDQWAISNVGAAETPYN